MEEQLNPPCCKGVQAWLSNRTQSHASATNRMAVSNSLNVPVRSHWGSSPSIDKVKLIVAPKSVLRTVMLSFLEFSISSAFSAVGELFGWVVGIVSRDICSDRVWRATLFV